MIFKILGCGTSTGVPVPGCACQVCRSNNPKNCRTRTSSLITLDNGKNILIDVSTDLRQQALREKIMRIDCVLFTHAHADHILGVDDLRSFCFNRSKPIPAYGTKATLDGIKRSFEYIFAPDPGWKGGQLTKLFLREIDDNAAFDVESLKVRAFPLIHGSTTSTGYRLGPVGYATDCNEIPPQSLEVLSGIKYLFIDGLRHNPHPSHLTIEQACAYAESIGSKETYLVHMTHTVDYEETEKSLPPDIHLAYDGLTITC